MPTKNGPIAGATFQEATIWWAMSGKAMQPAGLKIRTAFRELTRSIVSEGHVAEFAASFLSTEKHLPRQNQNGL